MATSYLDKTGLGVLWNKIKTKISGDILAEAGKMIPYGYCQTAAATKEKTVTVSPAITELETGLVIAVRFQYSNTASNPTLNVNSVGAKSIYRYGTTVPSTSAASSWNAGSVQIMIYNGSAWVLGDWNNTTYSSMTVAEIEAGTGTTARTITPARLKSAIELWGGGTITETDPTVPAWAKESTKPSYTASEVGALPDDTVIPTNTSQLNNDSSFVSSFAGDTSNKTPTEVAIAASAGKTISITHTDQTYGLLNFCAFNRATSAGLIVSTVSFNLNGVIYLYTLVGNTQNDSWSTNVSTLAKTTDIPTVPTDVSAFNNDAGYISSYTETDPTVPSWAKASAKPSYTASEVGAIPISDKQSYSSSSSLNWNSLSADQKAMVPTVQGIAFWNGAYDGTTSNLKYSANGSIIGTANLSSSGTNHTGISINATSNKTSSFTVTRAGYYPICIDRINLGGTGSDKICLNKWGITARSSGSVTYEVAYYNPTSTAYTSITLAVYVLWAKI